MIIRNLTPHAIVVRTGTRDLVLPAEPATPTVTETRAATGTLPIAKHPLPLYDIVPGPTTGLPDPRPDVLLIVARPVAMANPDRDDLYVPFDLVRDEHGQPVACRALARIRTG